MIQKSYDKTPTLYVIPTPIGNMGDMTFRAVEVLNSVEVIFCEDTRVTAQLLNHYNIKKKLISNHKYNENEIKEKLLEELNDGHDIALVSDRGMPGVSDPGYIGIKYIIENNFNVVALPGASAFLPALIMSGICPQPFLFYGFLNSKNSKRKEELNGIKAKNVTAIIYEAPHRLKQTLLDIYEVYGDIYISISREISKIHEEVIRDNISSIIEYSSSLKGEFVIILPKQEEVKEEFNSVDIKDQVNQYINSGLSKSDAIKYVAHLRGVSKNIIYNEFHKE